MNGERGSALVIAMLLMAILTLLGVSYLFMADTENRIAENERLSAQALYFGEGAAREVKRWFDRPPYSAAGGENLSRPTLTILDRTQRHLDPDGPGPALDQPADGSAALPFYKAGRDLDHDGNDDVFDKPYRPSPSDMFMGTADFPDVQIDRETSVGAAAFLNVLSERIMPDFPAGAAGVSARIKSIAVYAPPYLNSGGGNWVRYGIATVSVRVQILRDPGGPDEQVMADHSVSAVLNETPYGGVFGPLHSCDELGWSGSFKVHWGPATASTTASVPIGASNLMSMSIPRDIPATPRVDLLHGHLSTSGDTTWSDLVNNLQGRTIDDPWFRFFAGLGVPAWTAWGSPQVHPPGMTGQDESNKFQNYPNVPCPTFNYETWKSIAKSGGSDVHFYTWDNTSRYRENGTGLAREFTELTDGKTGIFFFDTADGLPPHDYDASNVAANLTPRITIPSSTYGTRGVVYLNTVMWHVDGSPGRPAQFTVPGEPYRDRNEDGVRDPGEEWINLRYSSVLALDDPLVVDNADGFTAASPPPSTPVPIWNPQGPTITHDAIVWGILYLAGQFDASGTPYYDGSVVTYAGTETGTNTVGTANLYWDPTMRDGWPPPDWSLPRVIISRWQTDE